MRAIAIAHPGGPEVLTLVDRPDPVAGEGEVLLRVRASGINRPDVLQRMGRYNPPAGASDLPGLEVAGEILGGDERAMAAHGFKRGDRVCALLAGGGYAEQCVAPVGQCLPVPEGWSDVEAASLPETLFTVWSNVFDCAALKSGETLLVQGGSSGIGVAAIQMAKAFGARVLVTAGCDEKCAACLALGADLAINYRREDFAVQAQAFTHGRGLDVVLDMVGGDYLPREVACMADDGRIAIIAVQGGTRAELDVGAVLRKRLTITGRTLRARSSVFKAAIAQQLREKVWPLLNERRIKPVVYQVFEAADVAKAHQVMESSAHTGKLVLSW